MQYASVRYRTVGPSDPTSRISWSDEAGGYIGDTCAEMPDFPEPDEDRERVPDLPRPRYGRKAKTRVTKYDDAIREGHAACKSQPQIAAELGIPAGRVSWRAAVMKLRWRATLVERYGLAPWRPHNPR